MSTEDVKTREVYNCDGTTFAFVIPFVYVSPSHVRVERKTITGVVSELEYGVEYIVVGTELQTVSIYSSGETLAIFRRTPRTQKTEREENTQFSANVLESDLDKGALIDQETDTADARILRFPISDPEIDALPTAERRKGMWLQFDPVTGQPIARALYLDTIMTSPFMDILLLSDDAEEFRETACVYTWYYGTTAPASTLGINGDYYIDTVTKIIYGPKTSGAWGSLVDLSEWQGSRRFISTSEPTSGDGDDGDFWFKHNA